MDSTNETQPRTMGRRCQAGRESGAGSSCSST